MWLCEYTARYYIQLVLTKRHIYIHARSHLAETCIRAPAALELLSLQV